MGDALLNSILHRAQTISSLPAVVQQLSALTRNPESREEDIVRLVSGEEILASRILRAANSSLFGHPEKVGGISQAVILLGLNTIRDLALGLAFASLGGKSSPSIHREELWRHSLATACAGKQMAMLSGDTNPDEVFTAGLLHDIGQVLLLEHFGEKYVRIMDEAREKGRPIRLLEMEKLGIDHLTLGRELCRHWQIPSSIEFIAAHHDLETLTSPPSPTETRRLASIHAGDNLARILQAGSDGETYLTGDFVDAMNLSGISHENLGLLMADIQQDVRKTELLYGFAKSTTPHTPPRPKHACVLLSNEAEREIIHLLLLTLDFTLVPPEELQLKKREISAFILDESITGETRNRLQKESNGIPLDFSMVRKQFLLSADPFRIHLEKLRVWLIQNLENPPLLI